MSSDLDILERLRSDPAPLMRVDLDRVVARGQQRVRRRVAGFVAAGCAAAVAVIAIGSSLLSTPERGSTTPAGTTSTAPGQPPRTTTAGAGVDPGLSGRHALTVGDAAYTMSVTDGLLTVDTVRDGSRERSVAGLVSGRGAWRVIDGTGGRQVVAGVVPGVAGAIELRPRQGEEVPQHSVELAPGADFTAFVVTFTEPLDTPTPAADIGWSASGPATSWILGGDAQIAGLAVTFTGEGAAPLAPYDFTRTGPPASTSGSKSVVISVDMPSGRIGDTATATLEGNLVVEDPTGLTARLDGADPETSVARGVFQLTDGRTFAWGIAPSGATGAEPHLDGGAVAGTPVLDPMHGTWTAYAVEIKGSPSQVSGIKVPLGADRGTLDVVE